MKGPMQARLPSLVLTLMTVVAAGVACQRAARPDPTRLQRELAALPPTLAELRTRLGPEVELETTLAQGRERLRRVTHLVKGVRVEVPLAGTPAERHGFKPAKITGPVAPRASITKEFAAALFELATVIESQPQHLLAACMAMHAKCAVAEPRVDVVRAVDWRCATVEHWAPDASGARFTKLFASAMICNGKNHSGRALAAVTVTLKDGTPLPAVALPGYAMVRHRTLERGLTDEILLGPRGAPARAALLYRLATERISPKFYPVRGVAIANLLLCGQNAETSAPCVTSPELLPKSSTVAIRSSGQP